MSYRGSGSRYPSAYGHTPSYRSVSNLPSTTYESPSSSFTSGLGRDMARDLKFDIDRDLKAFETPLSTSSGLARDIKFDIDRELKSFDTPLTTSSGLGGSSSSASKQVSSYSTSSYSSSATDGKRPVVESSYDSTYRSSQTGPSGVPHSSYAHSSASYSSENPYKNRSSNFSYNI